MMLFLPSLLRRSRHRKFSLMVLFTLAIACFAEIPMSLLPTAETVAEAQATEGRALTLRSDIQEANSKTGVITARGNVQIFYPARQIQATAAQAQYFSRERRMILSGNVYVLQDGNSLRGETIVYLIDEGRFVALPQDKKQVEAIYLVPESTPTTSAQTDAPFGTKPEFPSSTSDPKSAPVPSSGQR